MRLRRRSHTAYRLDLQLLYERATFWDGEAYLALVYAEECRDSFNAMHAAALSDDTTHAATVAVGKFKMTQMALKRAHARATDIAPFPTPRRLT